MRFLFQGLIIFEAVARPAVRCVSDYGMPPRRQAEVPDMWGPTSSLPPRVLPEACFDMAPWHRSYAKMTMIVAPSKTRTHAIEIANHRSSYCICVDDRHSATPSSVEILSLRYASVIRIKIMRIFESRLFWPKYREQHRQITYPDWKPA
jgi:hypothetical protein